MGTKEEDNSVKLRGADIVVRCLQEENVEVLFGYPGGAVLHIYDALYRLRFPHLLCRHEQGGIHMADGYARATGRPGVAMVTSGPALTNAITGIATAYADSIPLVIISGQVPTAVIGSDAFQEADNVGLTRPVTKHNYLVRRVEDIAPTIKEAFHIATTGRPGPVLVDIPKDVSAAEAVFHYPERVELEHYQPRYEGHSGQIKRAINLLLKARRPVIYFGGGVITSGASAEIRKLVELLNIPTTYTLMGVGGLPGDHPASLGMLGMHGTYRANMAVDQCDVLVAIGARFDDRVTGKLDGFSQHSKKIHIDIDPTSIRKNVHVDVPIVGDVRCCLQKLNAQLEQKIEKIMEFRETIEPWWRKVEDWNDEVPMTYVQPPDGEIAPQYVIDKIYELTEGNAIVATDVGQHQMWTAQFYHCQKPNNWITSGGLGTMGFGLPSAIGAQVGRPGELVVSISGDGGIQMNIQELQVAVEYNLPVKVVILNNGYLGMVRQWQQHFYDNRESQVLIGAPNFVKLADAFGMLGMSTNKPSEVEDILERGFAHPGPVLMEFKIPQYANCYPMVPPGAPPSKMILKDPY